MSNISQKRKIVADGVFYAEINELFTRELADEGYAGVQINKKPQKTEIVIRAAQSQAIIGTGGRRIRELTAFVEKRFNLTPGSIVIYSERVSDRGLSAVAQCESLRYKLLNGLAIRRAAYGVVRYVMESGAKGVEVVISGKLRAARAKSMKFQDGFMIHSGQPVRDFIDVATRHVLLRQGTLGIKVKIMIDPASKHDPKKRLPTSLPDFIEIVEPKPEVAIGEPHVVSHKVKPAPDQQEGYEAQPAY